MAHDYQYWRRARRSLAAYRFFSAKGGGPDAVVDTNPPIAAKMSERYPVKPRTANTAYWRQNAAMVADLISTLPAIQTTMPERAPTAKRADNSVYWRQNAAMIGDSTAVQIAMPKRYPVKLRSANTAYWRENYAMIGDLTAVQTTLPDRAPRAPRSANTAYWRDNQVQIANEVPQNGRVHEPRLTPRRAANTAYTRDNKLQINDEVPQNGRIFEPNPPVRRTANTAYFVNPVAVVADVTTTPPIVPVITDFARTAPRTGNTAYWQALRFQIDDLEVPQRGRAMDQVQPYRRSADSAYFVSTRLPDEIEFPPTVPIISDIYRRARAGGSAYWRNSEFVVANIPLDPPPIVTSIADIHRRARTANTAYWRNSQFVVEDFEFEEPPIRPFISDIARRHLYSSATAPWRWIGIKGGGIDVEPINDTIFPGPFQYRRDKRRGSRDSYEFQAARQIALLFKPEGKILFPEHNNTWRRRKEAANSAYWRPNTGQIVYVDFPAEITAKPIPVRYWKPLRAAQTAYWRDNFGPIPVITFPEELSVKVIPNRAPGARRSANSTYVINGKLIEATTPFDSEIGAIMFPDRARGRQRAVELAYWLPSPFLAQFAASLEPLLIGKARHLVLNATDRDFIIPAKRRVFRRTPKRP